MYAAQSQSPGPDKFWYSFDQGGVHVIQLSSEHDWTPSSQQYEWLANDLGRVNRTETPWVVVTAHRMMYTTQVPRPRHAHAET